MYFITYHRYVKKVIHRGGYAYIYLSLVRVIDIKPAFGGPALYIFL